MGGGDARAIRGIWWTVGYSGIEPNFILIPLRPGHPITEDQLSPYAGAAVYTRIPRDEKFSTGAVERAGFVAGGAELAAGHSVEDSSGRLEWGPKPLKAILLILLSSPC